MCLLLKLTTNLPVMSERIHHASQSPAMFLAYWKNFFRPCRPRLTENSVRICHRQNYSNRAATERLGTEVAMLRRLITQPKLRAIHGKPCHHASVGPIEAKDLSRSECGLVEANGSRTIPNRQPRCNRGHVPFPVRKNILHTGCPTSRDFRDV